MLKITESVKAEIEAATGQTVPDPQSKELEAFFEKLERDHPDLAKKLEDALEVTEPFPEEEAQQNAQRRENIEQTVHRTFFKEIWGRDVLNRRALVFILFFLIFGTVATSWTVMLLRKPGDRVAEAQPSAPTSTPQTTEPASQQPETTVTTSAPQNPPLLVVPEQKEEAQNDTPPKQLITSVPEAPRDIPLYTGNVPQPPTDSPGLGSVDNLGEQVAVAAFDNSEEGLESSPVLAFEDEPVNAPILAFEQQPQAQEVATALEAKEQKQQAPVLAEGFVAETNDELIAQESETSSSNPTTFADSPALAFEEVEEATNETPKSDQATLDSPPPVDAKTVTENDTPLLETDNLEPQTDTKNLL